MKYRITEENGVYDLLVYSEDTLKENEEVELGNLLIDTKRNQYYILPAEDQSEEQAVPQGRQPLRQARDRGRAPQAHRRRARQETAAAAEDPRGDHGRRAGLHAENDGGRGHQEALYARADGDHQRHARL